MNQDCSSSKFQTVRSTKSNFGGITKRLETIAELLREPHTVRELCNVTGYHYRTVYRDIMRLIFLGYKIKNNYTKYYIDHETKM